MIKKLINIPILIHSQVQQLFLTVFLPPETVYYGQKARL